MTATTTPSTAEVVPPGFGITDPRVLADVQGNILVGYGAKHVRHLVVRVADPVAARVFIVAAVSGRPGVPQVTTAERWDTKPATCLNVGVTATGLRALGLDERSLQTFPVEFVQGPVARAAKIGDVEASAPGNWRDGLGDPEQVHMMWSIHAIFDRSDLDEVAARLETMWGESGAFAVTSRIDGATFETYPGHEHDDGSKVHFGFRDSISQPRFDVVGHPVGKRDSQPLTPVGAVLLGKEYAAPFHDVEWQLPQVVRGSTAFDVGTNGCFNAFRMLDQHVHEFETFLEESAKEINKQLGQRREKLPPGTELPGEAGIVWDKERVAAKLMGRWRNGVPLSPSSSSAAGAIREPHLGPGEPVPPATDDELNDFEYPDVDPRYDDSNGAHCPIGAHIRRGNPRGSRIVQRSANYTRPIVRRGMPYGPPFDPASGPDDAKRGLIGNFLCASIVSQYEAIMYDWINLGLQDPRITGTNDPVIGANHPSTSRHVIPIGNDADPQEPIVLTGFPSFTTTAGCIYLFCPSITALRLLAGSWAVTAGAPNPLDSVEAADDGVTSRRWRMRKRFWNGLATLKFRGQKAAVVPVPAKDMATVTLVPFVTKHPDIPIDGIVVAETLPPDEVDPLKQVFTRVQHQLLRWYPPRVKRLPPVLADGDAALAGAYTSAHRACFPVPVRAAESLDLGALALASPYASYLTATGDGRYCWDLAHLSDFEVHRGLQPLGATVEFVLDSGRLTASRIESSLGVAHRGGSGWGDAVRMAVCTLTSHAAMIRHFNWLHLTAGPVLEAATRNHLPASHPVRRLLWPHVYGTHAGNELVTEILMSKGGEFDSIFSLSHRGKCDLFEATVGRFDLATVNPMLDAARRGVTELAAPATVHWAALYDVHLAHVRRYLDVYYASEDDVVNDQELRAWIADLDTRLPHGVRAVMGPEVTADGVATLLATVLHFATVEHEITGSGLWNYQLWSDTSPVRVYQNRQRVPVDVYQRLVNANFNLNVHRTMLLDDHLPAMALDARGRSAFVQFQQDMLRLQSELDRSAPTPWRIEPRHLKANINA